MRANLCEGWQPHKDGYGFFAMAHEEYQGDDNLTVRLWVNPSPKRIAGSVHAFPVGIEKKEARLERLVYALQGGILGVATTIDFVERSRLTTGKPGLYEGPIEIGHEGKVTYQLRFAAVYRMKGAPPPVSREYDTLPFLPGGLPELGKRR